MIISYGKKTGIRVRDTENRDDLDSFAKNVTRFVSKAKHIVVTEMTSSLSTIVHLYSVQHAFPIIILLYTHDGGPM